MLRFALRRLGISAVVLLGITIVAFAILRALPGDPAEILVDPMAANGNREAAVAAVRARLGLDGSYPAQYLSWLREAVQGNLGFSYGDGRPVTEVLGRRLLATCQLVLTSLVVAAAVATPLGLWAARRRQRLADYVVSAGSLLAISVPSFFLALAAIYVLCVKYSLLPTGGAPSTGTVGDTVSHMVLPVGILAFAMAGPLVRYVRAAAIESLASDYVITAKAKGVGELRLIRSHVLPACLPTLITVVAAQLPAMLGGAVVIEQLFAWPGLGRLTVDSVLSRDYPILLGVVLLIAVTVLLVNLLADLLTAAVDTRVQLEGRAR
ncbi:ABC transporter permease [Nocardioides carbamazepini]|uniref:ABC transporter permease n=1 Tax=Nocardioides carbamazepini TaxID=2854259 RepID=UPI002149A6CD|nr:ABC transporter permease [Nocardioides carbamazepini]